MVRNNATSGSSAPPSYSASPEWTLVQHPANRRSRSDSRSRDGRGCWRRLHRTPFSSAQDVPPLGEHLSPKFGARLSNRRETCKVLVGATGIDDGARSVKALLGETISQRVHPEAPGAPEDFDVSLWIRPRDHGPYDFVKLSGVDVFIYHNCVSAGHGSGTALGCNHSGLSSVAWEHLLDGNCLELTRSTKREHPNSMHPGHTRSRELVKY